jgi:hypothetical protein
MLKVIDSLEYAAPEVQGLDYSLDDLLVLKRNVNQELFEGLFNNAIHTLINE